MARRNTFWVLLLALLLNIVALPGCHKASSEEGELSPQPVSGETMASETLEQAHDDSAVEHLQKHLDPAYVCPMHPQITSSEPGTCPICGMDLVGKKINTPNTGSQRPAITLSTTVIQNMGVRTTRVKRETLQQSIATQGTVTYDSEHISEIHPRSAGWIEELYIYDEGERVKHGDELAYYFSPTALWAQIDYLDALEDDELSSFLPSLDKDQLGSFVSSYQSSKGEKARLRGTHDLLRYLKIPKPYLKRLEDTYDLQPILPIKAPRTGIITELRVREGMFVEPEDTLFTIADLSKVWVIVDIYEHQLAWIEPGLKAELSSASYPGQRWPGQVKYIYPEVNASARTARARLEFRNPAEKLLVNMFVEVTIAGKPIENILTVPRTALIVSGAREAVVKSLGEGRFQPVDVKTGVWRDDRVQILSGLAENDQIVVSGQFLIDSESSLQAEFLRMTETD